MSDEKALLAAIWEHPHEDTPRLVYADWLQETNTPANIARAEFIRVQCELAKLDEWDEDRRPTLLKREKKLWKQFGKVWQKELPAKLRKSPFQRGFVAPTKRQIGAGGFCKLAISTFAAAPTWDYQIGGSGDKMLAVAKCRNLLRIGCLKFWSGVSAKSAERILGSPYLRNVRSLELGLGKEWAQGLPALASNSAIENLTALDITDGFDDATAALLASSPAFVKLQSFGVYHHKLTPQGLRVLFRSPHLSSLTELTVPAWYGTEGAGAIASTRPKFRLQKLIMYGNWMTDEGVVMIANWPGLESVRELSISGRTQVLGATALAASPYASNLKVLTLALSKLDRKGALALARSKTLNLKRLDIKQTSAADDATAVAALVKRFGKDAVKVRYPGQRKRS
jgi:uncharacterized protein (TIGR02996 family)